MSQTEQAFKPPPFEARQYLLTLVLLGLGVWCVRDGWLNPEPEMQKYLLFNRSAGIALLAWGVWDGWRMRQKEVSHAKRRWQADQAASA